MNNAVSGSTHDGYLSLRQTAEGGAGGAGLAGGGGGAATSKLAFVDPTGSSQSHQVFVGVTADGAAGGAGHGAGGLAGAADAIGSIVGDTYAQGFANVYAIANGGAGGASATGSGEAGAAATAAANTSGDGYLLSQALSRGGAGGAASGAGHSGGAGGATSASATVANPDAIGAKATATQIGGAGGYGAHGAQRRRRRGEHDETNAVSGSTKGSQLVLAQRSLGGYGGSSNGGVAGAGGAATSSLTFDDLLNANRSGVLRVYGEALGGAGGEGYGGSSGAGGGQASSSLDATGSTNVSASSYAIGVQARQPGRREAPAAAAKATTTAFSGGSLYAVSSAEAGASGARVSDAGYAVAKTTATGRSGYCSASASTSLDTGQLVRSAAAIASGPVDGTSVLKACAGIGAGPPSWITQQAVALETGAPSSASTAAVLAANSNIKAAFGAAPVFFAIDELGGSYASSGGTTSETVVDTVSLTVDLTKLASKQNLVAGFYNATALGTGFTSLTFTLTGDGQTLINKTFTTLSAKRRLFSPTRR